jgi:tetratricopeptide (TPR) repeat protein
MTTLATKPSSMSAAARTAPAFFVVAAMVAPMAARADDGRDGVPTKARTLADRGRAAHEAGDYTSAITAFTRAYVMAPSPALLFNLAQAYRLQGNCDDAALMYRRYLATNPSPEERALAETHLASVERCLRKLALHIPVEIAPGRPAVAPSSDPLTAAVAAPAPSRRAAITKDIGVGLMLGGTAALAAAGYYAVRAHDAANDVAEAYAMGARWKDVAPLDERGKTAATRAWMFGAGGALGVTGGLVTYLIGRRAERPPVAITPKANGVEVSMQWTF